MLRGGGGFATGEFFFLLRIDSGIFFLPNHAGAYFFFATDIVVHIFFYQTMLVEKMFCPKHSNEGGVMPSVGRPKFVFFAMKSSWKYFFC